MRNESELARFDHETLITYQVSKWAARVLFTGGVATTGVELALGNMNGAGVGVAGVLASVAAYGASKAAEELLPPIPA